MNRMQDGYSRISHGGTCGGARDRGKQQRCRGRDDARGCRGTSHRPDRIDLPAGSLFSTALPALHNVFVFVYRGAVTIGGTTLNEPIAQRGRLVMSTKEEIYQAIMNLHEGRLA